MKKAFSFSIKNTGVTGDTPGVSPMTPQNIAKVVSGRADGGAIWGRSSLVSIVDRRILDKAHRILDLIGACSFQGPMPLGLDEIAWAVNCSRSSAIRHVRNLEKLGYLAVRRTRNRRNEYAVGGAGGSAQAAETGPNQSRVSAVRECERCRRVVRGLAKTGWCRGCMAEIQQESDFRDAMRALGPGATLRQIAGHMQVEKISRKLLRYARQMGVAA